MGSATIASLFAQRVVVGVGDLGVSNNPSITLSTYALGSCVAVVAYDPLARAGGLLHMMLPDSSISPDKAVEQPAMFADTGLPQLFRAVIGMKAERGRLKIFMAGGASVMCTNDMFKIGERNIVATRDFLRRNGFAIAQSALGGTINRTVHVDVGTGEITLKTPVGNDTFWLTI
jgi:chemotaxis protein CheD